MTTLKPDELKIVAEEIANSVSSKLEAVLRSSSALLRPLGYDCRGKGFTCGEYQCIGVVGCAGEFNCTIKFAG